MGPEMSKMSVAPRFERRPTNQEVEGSNPAGSQLFRFSPDSENETQPGQSFCGNLTGTTSVVEFGPETNELIFEFSRTEADDADADDDADGSGSFYNVTVRQIDCSAPLRLSNEPLDEYAAEPKVDQFRNQEFGESCDKSIGAREFMVGTQPIPL